MAIDICFATDITNAFLHVFMRPCLIVSLSCCRLEPWKKFHGDDPSGGYSSRFRRVHAEEEGLEADIESAIVVSVFKTVLTRIVNTPQKAFDTVSSQLSVSLLFNLDRIYLIVNVSIVYIYLFFFCCFIAPDGKISCH